MDAKDYLIAIRAEPYNLTQEQVADRTGIPQPTISKIERDKVKDVMSKTFVALQALHQEVTKAAA